VDWIVVLRSDARRLKSVPPPAVTPLWGGAEEILRFDGISKGKTGWVNYCDLTGIGVSTYPECHPSYP
jgi:hypothetical protein